MEGTRKFNFPVARRSGTCAYETPTPDFLANNITIWLSLPRGVAARRGKSISACGTPTPVGAKTGWCRRIAGKRRCRHLCHACTPLVARTCATLAPQDFEPNRPTGHKRCTYRPAQVHAQSCWRVRVPLIGRSTPGNRGPAPARQPATLLGG